MGRRKIEIKAIKDDRNRSVTFLKRKGGLFKKAHELSVLCSVDVAVFIFGSNKKLYEYSSCDMRELINRYAYHGGPNEHKGPSDFNGGADEDEDEDENGTPPQGDGMDAHMLPPHFTGQAPFPQIRHHTPGASPPIPNGMFGPHPVHPVARGHTPQPQMGSRPSSRNDIRRVGPGMMPQAVGPSGPPPPPAVNGFAYMPQPAIYNPQNQPGMAMPPQVHPTYPFSGPPPHPQMQAFVDEQRRSSVPPAFPQGPQGTPPVPRHSASPPQPHHQVPPQAVPHMSPPPPQIHLHPMQSPPQPQMQQPQIQQPQIQQPQVQHPSPPQMHEPPRAQPHQEYQPPAPVEPKTEPVSRPVVKAEVVEKPRQSLLLDTGVKKHKGSIFTPIDENRSILSQHLAAFQPEVKSESIGSRLQSIDAAKSGNTASPPRSNGSSLAQRNGSISSIPETTFTPPSRSNSLRVGTPVTARPRLKVQIPDEPSDAGSATAESSPRGTATDAASQSSRRLTDSHSSGPVLPPPSPSASAILSAGATGPPNPFARPIPPQNNGSMNVDTPASALPSRFLNGDFLPSPSSFYPDWNFRGAESNTLPSPLNFATPVAGNGPSFLRDDPIPLKRKSPEMSGSSLAHDHMDAGNEPKRVKVDS